MAWVNVDVDVDLSEFDDDDLIEQLESRDWFVGPEKGWEPPADLENDEIDAILERFQMSIPGTVGYDIYEKLRKR